MYCLQALSTFHIEYFFMLLSGSVELNQFLFHVICIQQGLAVSNSTGICTREKRQDIAWRGLQIAFQEILEA